MLRFVSFCIALSVLAEALVACSSTPSNSRGDGKWTTVGQMILPSLRIRRPDNIPADPKVGPGGEDYQSHPLPNSALDCQKPQIPMDYEAIRSCLTGLGATLKKPVRLTFRLEKKYQPTLSLQKKSDTPECVAATLAEIPVPREIFFQSMEADGALVCYASGIHPEEDQPIPFRYLRSKWELEFEVPLEKPPQAADEARLLVLSWALRPFKTADGQNFVVKPVPDAICRKCLGKGTDQRAISPSKRELWPSEEEDDPNE